MLGALAGLSFSMDKQNYIVGQRPIYRISGAVPGSQIAWTSYKDGVATGEYQAFYGDYVDNEGNATITAVQPWDASHVGTWEKHAIIIPPTWPNGTLENGRFVFNVVGIGDTTPTPGPAPVPTPTPTPMPTPMPTPVPVPVETGGGGISEIFEGTVELPVVGEVPKVALIAGGALLIFALSSGGSSSGRR